MRTTDNSVPLKSLKKGDYFTIANHDGEEVSEDIVYVRDDYDYSTRKYICVHFDDIGRSRQLKGSTRVFVGFIF